MATAADIKETQVDDSLNLKAYKQRLCLKLSEMDSQQSSVRSSLIVGSVVLFSGLATFFRQQFTYSSIALLPFNSGFKYVAWAHITSGIVETVCFATFTRIQVSRPNACYREAKILLVAAHAGFIMVLGYLTMLKVDEHRVVFAYFEPVVAVLVVFGTTKNPTKAATFGSILISSIGASIMVLQIPSLLNFNNTSFLTILISVCVSIRNITCKHLYNEQVTVVHNRGILTIVSAIIVAMSPVFAGVYLGRGWVLPSVYLVLSCMFSLAGTHLTCSVLLRNMNVTSVALVNLWVKIIYDSVFISYRPGILSSAFGIVLVLASQLVYTKKQLEYTGPNMSFKSVSTEEFYTRLQFLLFASGVGSLFFYALSPKVSERDLHVLSYVGLDGAVRKLLQQKSS